MQPASVQVTHTVHKRYIKIQVFTDYFILATKRNPFTRTFSKKTVIKVEHPSKRKILKAFTKKYAKSKRAKRG